MAEVTVHYTDVGPAGRTWTETIAFADHETEQERLAVVTMRAQSRVRQLPGFTRAAMEPDSARWGSLLAGPQRVGRFWIGAA